MKNFFGTDGVRGVANQELTPELAYRLGRIGAYVLTKGRDTPRIVLGRDTRISGEMLEAALTAGILSVGVDVYQAGIIPTPAVAYLTSELEAGAGVVISASHNPMEDNGVKFFSATGCKLSDGEEAKIESLLAKDDSLPRPVGGKIGRIYPWADAGEQYVNYLATLAPAGFAGLRIVLDCANGAAYQVAPKLWQGLGAEVVVLSGKPNGLNINANCGSTYPGALQKAVVKHKAHLGLAYDGDADRVLAVDELGHLVDGDQIMCISAFHLMAKGELKAETLVTTIMSNLGLDLTLEKKGIKVMRTQVGDRHVLAGMQEAGAVLGGEQSGHIIFLDHNTTGDGLVTGLKLASILKESGRPLSELAGAMPRFPQVQHSVPVRRRNSFFANRRIRDEIEKAQRNFSGVGRILVRPSGTEAKIRILVEGEKKEELTTIANKLVEVIHRELG